MVVDIPTKGGEKPAVALSGVRTFLFTDIEGSTRRWEADPDAMRTALEAHNQVLRETVAAHDGAVFNYTGDGENPGDQPRRPTRGR